MKKGMKCVTSLTPICKVHCQTWNKKSVHWLAFIPPRLNEKPIFYDIEEEYLIPRLVLFKDKHFLREAAFVRTKKTVFLMEWIKSFAAKSDVWWSFCYQNKADPWCSHRTNVFTKMSQSIQTQNQSPSPLIKIQALFITSLISWNTLISIECLAQVTDNPSKWWMSWDKKHKNPLLFTKYYK